MLTVRTKLQASCRVSTTTGRLLSGGENSNIQTSPRFTRAALRLASPPLRTHLPDPGHRRRLRGTSARSLADAAFSDSHEPPRVTRPTALHVEPRRPRPARPGALPR